MEIQQQESYNKDMGELGYCQIADLHDGVYEDKNDSDDENCEYQQMTGDGFEDGDQDNSDSFVSCEIENGQNDNCRNKNEDEPEPEPEENLFNDFEEASVGNKWSHIKIDHQKIKEDMAKISFGVKPTWHDK